MASEVLRQIPIDEPLRHSAWRRFKELRLPMLSLTDCTSFEVMDKLGIKEAFTFDVDSSKAGKKVIPADK